MRALPRLGFLLMTAGLLPAQSSDGHVSGIETEHYGAGCNPVFAAPPEIKAGLDDSGSFLVIAVDGFPGCCNTFLLHRLLVLGPEPARIPLPQIGPGCVLLVRPRFGLLMPAHSGNTFRLRLPDGVPPLQVFAQGALHYFTTIGLAHDLALTDGLRIRLF